VNPNRLGAIAEAAIAWRATQLGVPVLAPVFEDQRYDLVFDLAGRFVRVQCKSARVFNNMVDVKARTCRRIAGGYMRTTYSAEEVDVVAAYAADLDRCYLIPLDRFPASGCLLLRLAPAKNNQLKRLNFAADYEFGQGAIAQLGERVSGRHEVAGSSPASSTPEEPRIARLFS
jgi:hypothetical protein